MPIDHPERADEGRNPVPGADCDEESSFRRAAAPAHRPGERQTHLSEASWAEYRPALAGSPHSCCGFSGAWRGRPVQHERAEEIRIGERHADRNPGNAGRDGRANRCEAVDPGWGAFGLGGLCRHYAMGGDGESHDDPSFVGCSGLRFHRLPLRRIETNIDPAGSRWGRGPSSFRDDRC